MRSQQSCAAWQQSVSREMSAGSCKQQNFFWCMLLTCMMEIPRRRKTVPSSLYKISTDQLRNRLGVGVGGVTRPTSTPFYSRILDRYLKAIIASFLHVMSTLGISETVFKENMVFGTLCRSWLLLALAHSQLREKGGVGKISPIGWPHLYICLLISKTTNRKREKGRGRGREGVRADIMSLNRHFIEHGPHKARADFNPMP